MSATVIPFAPREIQWWDQRPTMALLVPCRRHCCRAPIGEPCIARGIPSGTSHVDRIYEAEQLSTLDRALIAALAELRAAQEEDR